VTAWNAEWGESLDKVLKVTLTEGTVEILAKGKSALADGTPAEAVEYRAIIAGYPMHCYSLGVKGGGWWVAINLWNIDQYANFNRGLFEEIAHTLEFE
jgi:hypothetical protein